MCVCGLFPASRQHQSHAARMRVRVYTQHVSHSAKMTERLEQRYCIKLCQKLGDSQVETVRKIQWVLATMAWASHKLRIGTTDSKMAARWWRATLVLVGPQQAEMMNSLTNVDFGLVGSSCHHPRTCGGGGDKHWFGTFHFDQ
jgi:hypothetical protein